jgi:peptidyl-prolyl cis-trans isomerase A (cyclophilin A)
MKDRYFRLREICFVYWIAAIIVCGGIAGCASQKKYNNPVVVIETKFGNITVALYPQKAPATVSAFLRNIDSGYFDNCSFYRVLRNDNQVTGALHSHLIQGGIWQSNPDLKSKFNPIPHEPTNQTGILHTRGVISMARNEPGTATSEFFICVEDEPGFDYGGKNNADEKGYSAFGAVVEGMETVMKIYRQPEDNQRFIPPVTILNIHRLQQEIPVNISPSAKEK